MADLSIQLSKSFTLEELCRSDAAERIPKLRELQGNPSKAIVDSLRYLATTALQPVRDYISVPLAINSGYRHPDVNALIGGSATSQHCLGEAADCRLLPEFLKDPSTAFIRSTLSYQVAKATGSALRADVNENFYLFAFVVLNLELLDIDQVIHEGGTGFGRPVWIHLSASKRQSKREILFYGDYTAKKYVPLKAVAALKKGTVA
jgi:hypothetical protein